MKLFWDPRKAPNKCELAACDGRRGATLFNQPLGDWNVEQVKSMGNMFSGAYNFNMGWNIRRDCRTTNMLGRGDDGRLAMQKMRTEGICCTIS